MTEEEKKAIEILENEKSNLYVLEQTKFITCTVEQAKAKRKAIDTVLNLITKLQKENEEKNKQIDLMAEKIHFLGSDKDCKDCIKKYFEKLAKEKGE